MLYIITYRNKYSENKSISMFPLTRIKLFIQTDIFHFQSGKFPIKFETNSIISYKNSIFYRDLDGMEICV